LRYQIDILKAELEAKANLEKIILALKN